MTTERHIDDDPLATGIYSAPAWSPYLFIEGADFKSCGVAIGLFIENTTCGTSGLVTAVTENTVTAEQSDGDSIDWHARETLDGGAFTDTASSTVDGGADWATRDDGIDGGSLWSTASAEETYKIYKTATKDSFISKIYTDRRDGFKITSRSDVNERWHFPSDEDLDANREHVFGPGQPEHTGRG
jgi:hypothetical protein